MARNAQRGAHISQIATPGHDDVARPLSDLRNQWRVEANEDALMKALRMKVKAHELDAEQSLKIRLEA
ncbi:DUF2390 domain-containing protein, partial [Pseudomonas syringae group genomosp. 7]|uniref:DUF2390 domain-containing protein n=1 Tax=Pseudomonas syringae group genomosp. 7 TaxID=251699 RepID=UPI0037704A36